MTQYYETLRIDWLRNTRCAVEFGRMHRGSTLTAEQSDVDVAGWNDDSDELVVTVIGTHSSQRLNRSTWNLLLGRMSTGLGDC